MNIYTPFDYLCNEDFYFPDIGFLHSPTLRDIRKITYNLFMMLVSAVTMPLEELKSSSAGSVDQIRGDEAGGYSRFDFLLTYNASLLSSLLCFFINGRLRYRPDQKIFLVEDEDNGSFKAAGHVGNDNFDKLCLELTRLLGVAKEARDEKFKNEYARKMYARMQKKQKEAAARDEEAYSLDNMIRKFVTHNKTGINILNVWDMTYYQFTVLFQEYCSGRQYDINDLMAANTFSYKKGSDYKPFQYLKNIT